MKALEASPKTLKSIFATNYYIPDFQRPYSWDTEECDQLWTDLMEYYENLEDNNAEDKYFMGTIVVFEKDNSDTDNYVIDGQQRLTTLQLLIKALYEKSATSHALKSCMQKKHPTTENFLDELRLVSEVLSDDFQSMEKIILNKGVNLPSKRFQTNFQYFKDKLEEFWINANSNPGKMERLISLVLNNLVLLPIKCGSQDDALTLFDTINNRGLPLSDADIFKAKLHKASEDKKDEFVKSWSQLKSHDWLFRVYMHILRAKLGIKEKEVAMRTFFLKKPEILQDWTNVMFTLKKCFDVEENNSVPTEMMVNWEILRSYPNYYWMFPLYVFLNQNAEYDSNTETLILDSAKLNEFTKLLNAITKYVTVRGLVYNSVNKIKDHIYSLCVMIQNNGDFVSYLKAGYQDDLKEFESRLINGEFGRYNRLLILLGASLNPNQNQKDFYDFLNRKIHVEHILPRKWNHYDNWDEDSYDKLLNSIGNLAPFEENLNISAQNEFFGRKRDKYAKSKVQDLRDLSRGQNAWYPHHVIARKEELEKRILSFVNQ
ncbi:DUF262 domain-containing protein [Leptospira sp. 201903075]|uniref:DUF262 domain-containing protein n=1 Tax=Leptospira chreensis TaxID=2810035 RepID=UPI0019637BB0|nr:DUF262 domain-containing protein [Leptospira chreensis]MBM9592363.1 DUF262 domain-containing protein [Leptospira chreensis]